MNDFVFGCPVKVYFGKGAAKKALDAELKNYSRIMLAYGGGSIKKNGIYDQIISAAGGKIAAEFSGIMPNPTYEKVQEGAKIAREKNVDFILAAGGGSVMDCCKVVAAQAKTERDVWEMENSEKKFPAEMLKTGAIVTSSGTGSEMNNGAVITHQAKKIKGALFAAYNEFAALDPEYTLSVPMRQVVSGAFDTLSHCMETYFGTPRATFVSDEINESVMRNTIRNIRAAIKNPMDVQVRSELMWDSAMGENGILKLGKSSFFQAHQIEHQLGAYTDCNHGEGLAVIHPVLYRHVFKGDEAKFERFAREVWGEKNAEDGIAALSDFIRETGLPENFRGMGITDGSFFPELAESVNIDPFSPKVLDHKEILEILYECF